MVAAKSTVIKMVLSSSGFSATISQSILIKTNFSTYSSNHRQNSTRSNVESSRYISLSKATTNYPKNQSSTPHTKFNPYHTRRRKDPPALIIIRAPRGMKTQPAQMHKTREKQRQQQQQLVIAVHRALNGIRARAVNEGMRERFFLSAAVVSEQSADFACWRLRMGLCGDI